MYRKIIIMLFFNFQSINISLKMSLIILVMFLGMVLYANFNPFVNKNYNTLEYFSSIAAFALVFAAYLYVLEVNVNVKAMCFVVISFTNILFFIPWIFSILRIIIFKYESFFIRRLPKIAIFILVIYDVFQKIGFNLTKLIRQSKASYLKIKENFEYDEAQQKI